MFLKVRKLDWELLSASDQKFLKKKKIDLPDPKLLS